MNPRPANPETRERLLQAAEDLVLVQGFAATGVEQICRQAGVTKGGFFHYFPSKQDLAVAIVESFGARRLATMRHGSHAAREDPRQRLFGYLDWMISVSEAAAVTRGCLIGNLAQECSHSSPAIRDAVSGRFTIWADFLEEDLQQAKKLYAPRASWTPKSLACHLIAAFEGSLLLAKASGDATLVRQSLQHFRSYLQTLLGSPSGGSASRKRRAAKIPARADRS